MSVNVTVRVRPFNQREIDLGSTPCIQMQTNTTILKDEQGEERTFTFDNSFWSFDGFKISNGIMKKSSDQNFIDQEQIYHKIGQKVLEESLKGYHCCLFAYGQTGSGKSFSMVGYGPDQGIIPRLCSDLMQKKVQLEQKEVQVQVQISMLEIYNERVQDLLVDFSKRSKEGLKVRQNKQYGVYVEGLTKHNVTTIEQIDSLLDQGNKSRTIASTLMNQTSS